MLAPVVALVLSLLAPLILLPFLGGQGLVDMPGKRRAHSVPTVRGGGIGVAIAILIGLLAHVFMLISQGIERIPFFFLGVSLIIVWFSMVGIFDDIYGLNTQKGILFLALGGIWIALFAMQVIREFRPFHSTAYLVIVMIVLVPLTVWVTNAVNYMDGINGITVAHMLVVCGWFWLLHPGNITDPINILAPTVAAAFLGFAPWNMPRARLFLGEAGAYVAGALTIMMGLILWVEGVSLVAVVAPFLAYWLDVIFTGAYRIFHHLGPLSMHREHNYQQLQRYFGSHFAATIIVTCVQLSCVCLAWVMGGVEAPGWSIFVVALPAIIFAAWPIPKVPGHKRPVNITAPTHRRSSNPRK
ncbi:MAG TPA: hypothetical protein GX530_00015 [Corynebacteriales bacterium]|nr:hypothetical protein [Mycobacteriales bacterium]